VLTNQSIKSIYAEIETFTYVQNKFMSIKKNVVYNSILNIANVLFPFITVPYVSRVLGPNGVGISSFATVYAGYFGIFAALGIPMYGIREVAKIRDDKYKLGKLFTELFTINSISVIFFSCLYIISIFIVPQLHEQKNTLFAAGLLLFFSSFTIDWFLSGLEQFKIITVRSLIIKVLSIAALFIFVKHEDDIIPYILISVFAQLGNQLWNFLLLYKNNIAISFKSINLKQHFKPLMILYISAIAISIYTVLDTLMLGFLSNYSQVAYYTSATKISKIILPIVTSLGTVLLPRIAYYNEIGKRKEINNLVKESFSLVVFLALPFSMALILIAPYFVPIFFGVKFIDTILPMEIMSLLLISIGINNLSGIQILVGLGYEKLFMKSVIYGTIINLCMNLILIPLYGAIGASCSSVTAETFIAIVSVYYVYKYVKIKVFSLRIFWNNLWPALLFIPLICLLSLTSMKPWTLLITFTIFGSALYIILQYYFVKNEALFIVLDFIKNKIKNK